MRVAPIALSLAALWACGNPGPSGPPYSVEQALDAFEIHPDFQIELFAAEPDVADPVAVDFGPDGRIWVAENSGYPLDVEGKRGRIRVLRDTDGDGRPDRSTLFADGLTMPTGVMAYRDGVLATDAPDVLYLVDTDGDDRADKTETVLTGFAFTNPQHTVSSPVWGLNNWIYLSHEGYTRAVVFSEEFGDVGSEIRFPDRQDGPHVPVARRSVRFRPETYELELTASPSQFGQTFSEWGELFVHNNTYHSRQEVIAARYLERNPRLRVPRTVEDVYAGPSPAAVHPITKDPRFEILSGVGQMTSACGLTRYLGGAFGPYDDLAFVAEPVHNVVHADRWTADGALYRAKPLLEGKEFLASRDAWFRAVNFSIGPDGALYVVDYYRDVIEHPEWTSAETYESEAIYHGAERGRIWRITPKAGLPLAPADLERRTDAELVEQLRSENIWRRRTAQRLLFERRAIGVAAALEALAADDAEPLGQVHALWTLDGIGELRDETVAEALRADEPGVRRNAVLLAEPRLRSDPKRWVPLLLPLGDDPDGRVRLQLLLTLGWATTNEARLLRDELLFASLDDEWMTWAALTWPEGDPAGLYSRLIRKLGDEVGPAETVAALAGTEGGDVRAMLAAVERDVNPLRRAAGLRGLASAASKKSADSALRARLLDLALGDEAEVRTAAVEFLERVGVGELSLDRPKRLAANENIDPAKRAAAIHVAALGDPDAWSDRLRDWIGGAQPPAVQAAAVAALGKTSAQDVSAFLLERWRELPSEARRAAGEALAATPGRAQALTTALEGGAVQPWMLEFRVRRSLIMSGDPKLRERARRALTSDEEDRRELLQIYQAALAEREGDPSRGRVVFERICSECHQLNGKGSEVGPDLATVRTRPALNILTDIVLPNQSIAQTYEAYVIETTDGRILDGVIGPQGPTFVTLRREGGVSERIERSQIASMRAAQLSAMPSDLEQQISPAQMVDLIRYIQTAQ